MKLRGGPAQVAGNVWMIDTPEEASRLLRVLFATSEAVGIDLEYSYTKGRHNLEHSRITCLTLAYVPAESLGRHPTGAPLHQRVFVPAFESDELVQLLKPWLQSARPKVGHNIISADAHVLRNHGIVLGGVAADTLRKVKLTYNDKDMAHGLKPCMARELGYDVTDLASIDTRPRRLKPKTYKTTGYRKAPKSSPLYGTGIKVLYGAGEVGVFAKPGGKTSREVIPHAELWRDYPQRRAAFTDYASLDAKGTAELDYPVTERLRKLPAAGGTTNLDLYRDTWQPYCELVAAMEVTGIPLDASICNDGAALAGADVAAYDAELEAIEPGWNWGSSEQLATVLFRHWNLPRPPIGGTVKAIKPTKPDQWSTAEASLHWLELNCPDYREALGLIRQRRKARRLYGYLRDLPGFLHNDGRLHSVMAPSTDTGRLASSNPALQQMPNAKSDKYGIRRAFVAGPGKSLIVADYSQLEVYVLAHFLLKLGTQYGWSGADALVVALATGDVYSYIAKTCWPGVAWAAGGPATTKVPSGGGITYRDLAKIVVLASNYGKTEQGLAISLLDEAGVGVGLEFARSVLGAYAAGLPGQVHRRLRPRARRRTDAAGAMAADTGMPVRQGVRKVVW